MPADLLRGGVYVHRGRYQEADAQAQHALRLNPLEPRAHLLQGMIGGLDFNEEFAADLSTEPVVDFCRQSVQRLRPSE